MHIVISAEPLSRVNPTHCAMECSVCGPIGVAALPVVDLMMRDHAATHMKERV